MMNITKLIPDTEGREELADKAFAAIGRIQEQMIIYNGGAALPEDYRTEEHYVALGELTLGERDETIEDK